MNTILQVPVKKELRDEAAKAAERMGFSSLQESVRIFLKQLAEGEIRLRFEQSEAITAVLESREEAKKGKAKKLSGSLEALWYEAQASND